MTTALSRGKSLALALGLILALGVTAASAVPAAAATGTFRLCNMASDYTAYATFSNTGGFSTYAVGPGQCTSHGIPAGSPSYNVTIHGTWAWAPYKSTTMYSIPSGRSIDFHAGGTFSSPQFTPLVY